VGATLHNFSTKRCTTDRPQETRLADPIIRAETCEDHEAIRRVNLEAFHRSAEEILVDRLRSDGLVVTSLVAVENDRIVGHILFSRLPIHMGGSVIPAVALAPMAVIPSRQRQGVGSALVRNGLRACQMAGERIVIVLGHPDYYQRFAFSSELACRLQAP
jgi:putative acetyltransferase